MDEENKEGVKEPEGPGGEPQPNKTSPDGSEAVKTPEELADELLNQGREGKQRRIVDTEKFNEINDKAKAYDAFAPAIDKLKGNPELIDELLETKKKGDLETRVARMEADQKEAKRNEMRGALTEALSKWPNFGNEWGEISEDVEKFMKKGYSARDAMSRFYIALHPEAAQAEAERIAKENALSLGKYSSSNSFAPKIKIQPSNEVELTPGERQVAKSLGKSEAEYAALLEKHKSHMKARGFYKEELETQL